MLGRDCLPFPYGVAPVRRPPGSQLDAGPREGSGARFDPVDRLVDREGRLGVEPRLPPLLQRYHVFGQLATMESG